MDYSITYHVYNNAIDPHVTEVVSTKNGGVQKRVSELMSNGFAVLSLTPLNYTPSYVGEDS